VVAGRENAVNQIDERKLRALAGSSRRT